VDPVTLLPAPEPDIYGRYDYLATPVYHLGEWHGNARDEYGVDWIVESEDGWSGSPARRITLNDRSTEDGAYNGIPYYGARVITLSGKALAASRADMLAAKRRFAAVMPSRAPQRLVVVEADVTLQAYVLPTGENKAKDTGAITFDWSFQCTAADPRKYELFQTVGGTALPSGDAAGGARFPVQFPLRFGDPSSYRGTGNLRLVNNGTYVTFGQVQVTGPTDWFTVTQAETGRTLSMKRTPLTAADTVTFDLATRQVLVNSTVRNDLLDDRGWFAFLPGLNTLQFRGVGGDAASCSASFYGAYI
jgi:hypothetical protein